MSVADIVAAHIQSMNAMTTTNLEEVKATSEKLRHVLGDPYAACRLLRENGESASADPAGSSQPAGGAE